MIAPFPHWPAQWTEATYRLMRAFVAGHPPPAPDAATRRRLAAWGIGL